ncbi:MAG: PLP-dependent transferase [Chloroflexi bacterium]|nr:PLP-dependent transferase [Chloroflexota bacterium]
MEFDTLPLTGGRTAPASGGVPNVPPIVPSVGYVHSTMAATDAALDGADFVYGRNANPTPAMLEEVIAQLEESEDAVVFGSGMAAVHAALLATALPGATIVAAEQLYGVTRTLLDWMAYALGYSVHYADFLDVAAMRHALAEYQPAAVVCEVLTNPLAQVVRLDHVLDAAGSAQVIVDNTFATPMLLRPIPMGAALVVHSATKFINGHGDVLAGVVAGGGDLIGAVREFRTLLGANLDAFGAWLALRGVRTLALRMRQSCASALAVAQALADHPRVERVYYPGLPTDRYHADAAALFGGDQFGATLAFDLAAADRDMVFAFVESLTLIQSVTSLGDIFTEISHPATASHRSLSPQQQAGVGIREGTLRLSIGIEAPSDIIADLIGALDG